MAKNYHTQLFLISIRQSDSNSVFTQSAFIYLCKPGITTCFFTLSSLSGCPIAPLQCPFRQLHNQILQDGLRRTNFISSISLD